MLRIKRFGARTARGAPHTALRMLRVWRRRSINSLENAAASRNALAKINHRASGKIEKRHLLS